MEPGLSRIVVESEGDWLRIKDNVNKAVKSAMEARLATLPKDGEQSRALRAEVERRIAKAGHADFSIRLADR